MHPQKSREVYIPLVCSYICMYICSTVNKRADNGTTPLYFASQEGRLDCLQFLITQTDANPRLRANDGMAPIHAAAQMGQLNCLAWLVCSYNVYNYMYCITMLYFVYV